MSKKFHIWLKSANNIGHSTLRPKALRCCRRRKFAHKGTFMQRPVSLYSWPTPAAQQQSHMVPSCFHCKSGNANALQCYVTCTSYIYFLLFLSFFYFAYVRPTSPFTSLSLFSYTLTSLLLRHQWRFVTSSADCFVTWNPGQTFRININCSFPFEASWSPEFVKSSHGNCAAQWRYSCSRAGCGLSGVERAALRPGEQIGSTWHAALYQLSRGFESRYRYTYESSKLVICSCNISLIIQFTLYMYE